MTQCTLQPRPTHVDVPSLTVLANHFSTHALAADQQLLAWRERVGHVIDVPVSSRRLAEGFAANIDRYVVGGMSFTDCRTHAIVLDRSVARVSTDVRRDYVFHLFVEGQADNVTSMHKKRSAVDSVQKIIAFDMNQPFRIERSDCRVLTLFVPKAVVDAELPDGESIHGRVVPQESPLAGLILDHVSAIGREISQLDPRDALNALTTAAQLLAAAFRKESRLMGASRAAVQAAVMGQVRRYVEANLHQTDLTPASVVQALQLKRATVYRWFEHEGGLGVYIRHRRLRIAADELVRFPNLLVTEVAYGLGFKSASDFTRAFRRAFDMSPQDMRARAFDLQHLAGVLEHAQERIDLHENLSLKSETDGQVR